MQYLIRWFSHAVKLIISLFMLLFMLNHAAWANEEKISIVTELWPPYQFINDQGHVDGYAMDVVKALFLKTQHNLPHVQILPWSRAYDIASTNSNVMIFSLARTPERENQFQWIGGLQQQKMIVWGLKSDFKRTFNRLSDLSPYIISITINSGPDIFLAKHKFKRIHRVVDPKLNIAMLFKKRVHLNVIPEMPFRRLIESTGHQMADVIKVYEIDELNSMISIAFSPTTAPDLVQQFQQAFIKLDTSGELKIIQQKWLK